MTDFANFITVHDNDDTDRLILSRDKWEGIDIPLAVSTILGRRKIRHKVPQWHACPEVIYPTKLCVEQCSSEATARLKREMILSYAAPSCSGREGIRIADLTGGLGVDSFFFAGVAGKVLYNEADPVLAGAAAHNFDVLGLRNIETCNFLVGADGEADLTETVAAGISEGKRLTVREILGDFRPDVIYLDPARRSAERKVFLIEDCKPDILSLKDSLLEAARFVAVKLSPMADITMVANRLGRCCREISAISTDGECKEIVALMDREYDGDCIISARTPEALFQFLRSEEEEAEATFVKDIVVSDCGKSGQEDPKTGLSAGTGLSEGTAAVETLEEPDGGTPPERYELKAGMILLEPDKALMKTAPFKLLCSRFGIAKLGVSTHYYLSDGHPLSFRAEPFGEVEKSSEKISPRASLGRDDKKREQSRDDKKREQSRDDNTLLRAFRILKVLPFDKRTVKAVRQEFPNAGVTARNFPIDSASLRKKLGVGESDRIHIFGLRVLDRNCLIVTEKIQTL